MVYFWLILVIILGFIESITASLVSIWFVLSGIIALILSIWIDSFSIQFAVFVIFGIIFMLLIRKYFKLDPSKKEKTNLDRIIGMKGIVTEDIDEIEGGEIKVDGKKWSCMSNEKLKKGEFAKVLNIQGVKLKVERWKE